jgi:hypothetical protein
MVRVAEPWRVTGDFGADLGSELRLSSPTDSVDIDDWRW